MSLPQFYQRYVDNVPDIKKGFEESEKIILVLLTDISEEKMNFSYAEGKWTIKEVIQHIIDTERILSYRLLSIARGEKQNLLPFEENAYAQNSHTNLRSKESLMNEFQWVRKSTKALFDSFTIEDLEQKGKANSVEITVDQLVRMLIGHVFHHIKILKKRYL